MLPMENKSHFFRFLFLIGGFSGLAGCAGCSGSRCLRSPAGTPLAPSAGEDTEESRALAAERAQGWEPAVPGAHCHRDQGHCCRAEVTPRCRGSLPCELPPTPLGKTFLLLLQRHTQVGSHWSLHHPVPSSAGNAQGLWCS